MSIFDNAPTPDEGAAGATQPVADPPSQDAGGAAAEVPSGSEPEGSEGAPAPSYLDPEQYGSHLVKVKIGGEDVELPFSDAIQGVMRQGDYTRKTQELAEERRRLQQADALVAALEQNPVETLKQLASVYDLDPDAGLSPVEREPHEQQLVDMQRQLNAQQEQFTRQMMQNEIAALRSEHGDVDVPALANFASANGLTLTVAHQVMQAQEVLAKQAEAAQAEQRRQAALATQVAHNGTATQRGTVAVGAGSNPPQSIKEAWALARQMTQ